MKCKKCGSEWTISPEMERKTKNCPFCGAALAQKNKTMNTMEDVIRAMREDFGLESLEKKNMLLGSFMDLAPHMKREQQMLRLLVESNGHTILIQALSRSKGEQRTEIEKLVQQMHEQRFVDEGIARRICVEFFRGIGGRVQEQPSSEREKREECRTNRLHPNKIE